MNSRRFFLPSTLLEDPQMLRCVAVLAWNAPNESGALFIGLTKLPSVGYDQKPSYTKNALECYTSGHAIRSRQSMTKRYFIPCPKCSDWTCRNSTWHGSQHLKHVNTRSQEQQQQQQQQQQEEEEEEQDQPQANQLKTPFTSLPRLRIRPHLPPLHLVLQTSHYISISSSCIQTFSLRKTVASFL